MTQNRVKFNTIVKNQLPSYVREEYPLVADFLSQYYIAQEFKGAPLDLLQNIDKYIKLDETTNLNESVVLLNEIDEISETITIDLVASPNGIKEFPNSYGLLKIGDEIITYTGKTINSFTGCVRGFSGISKYGKELTFSTSEAEVHTAGTTITNLSVLFLKEFLFKTKHQLAPGLENRTLDSELNQNVFLKQVRDFYSSKGTDRSFEILFKALYNEEVKIIRPGESLIRPSDANYQVTNDFAVESVDGDPFDLVNLTLFQSEYGDINSAYGPVSNVEKLNVKTGGDYYRVKIDAGYNRDLNYEGAVYGAFSVHPKTSVIGDVLENSTSIDVDSTIGFPESGEVQFTYADGNIGFTSYTSKSINQFYGCDNIVGKILDNSSVGINTYARATNEFGEEIRVRISSVLDSLDPDPNAYFYNEGDSIALNSLGVNFKNLKSKNWISNFATKYNVLDISLSDSINNSYSITLDVPHIFRIGENIKLVDEINETFIGTILSVNSEKDLVLKFDFAISTESSKKYKVHRYISKINSADDPELNIISSNVQNVYFDKDKTLVASNSLPSFKDTPLAPVYPQILFSGTFNGDTFTITPVSDHGFYTGDEVYYKPEQIVSDILGFDNEFSETIVDGSFLFDEGIYYVKRVDANNIKLAKSRADIDKSKFVSIEGPVPVTNNLIAHRKFYSKKITAQKILREVSPPENDGNTYETVPGKTGILVNGVEILNYKSSDVLYYGGIEKVNITSPGSGFDVINPPDLLISDTIGTGATGYCAVSGSLQRIDIVDPGFDYRGTPTIEITGGNGSGAIARANMKLIPHEIIFNSDDKSQRVGLGSTQSTIGFSTYHKFSNLEPVIYKADSQTPIGGLESESIYYVSVQTPQQIKLHKSYSDAAVGLNTVTLSSYGVGVHRLNTVNKKSVLDSVSIVSSGTGYENKKKTCTIAGISTVSNQIKLHEHEFQSGEIVKYYNEGTPVSGLTTNTEYYLTKIDDNSFRLSQLGSSSQEKDFFYKTKQYIELTDSGSGLHIFNYPEISVEVVGNVGISSVNGVDFKAKVSPKFTGSINSVHLESKGYNYGSSQTFNYQRQPSFNLSVGSEAVLVPIVANGSISKVIVNNGGSNYISPPELVVEGDGLGSGASLTPIIENGRISSVYVVSGGSGYEQTSTTIDVIQSGSGFNAVAELQTWNVNLFQKYFKNISDDDGILTPTENIENTLQYCNLYAPRKLREIIYSTDNFGNTLYSKTDLRKNGANEINSTDHSPIIGWAYDGNPIYGPYAYSKKEGGSITQMKSGYKLVSKQNQQNRPSFANFPQGFFIEDYSYVEVNDDSVLDKNNGRFCITPDFPNGTYAYFATFLDSVDSTGSFVGYKRPAFPYIIGNSYVSKPNPFNFNTNSNQEKINLNETNWKRNVYYYNLKSGNQYYDYVNLPNNLEQIVKIKSTHSGKIDKVDVEFGGYNYKINDELVFDNDNLDGTSKGFGASAKVSRLSGRDVNTISLGTTSLSNVEINRIGVKNTYELISTNPHELTNLDTINVSGLSSISNGIKGIYTAGISSNTFFLVGVGNTNVGIGTLLATGISTYIQVRGDLNALRVNDFIQITDERLKVLEIDKISSRLRVLREIGGTVGVSHTTGETIYEVPRKILIDAGFRSDFSYRRNKEIYFNPSESVGVGTIFGVGIGTTLSISNPGSGSTQIFVPTKSIFLPDHGLLTGDVLTYSANDGDVIGVSTDGIDTSLVLSDPQTLYVAKVSNDLIGVSTVKVGLGTTGFFYGITPDTNSIGTLYFTGFGTNTYHSFKTNYSSLTGSVTRNIVTVSTAQTHGLKNDDQVYIEVNPSTTSTIVVKYNDYHSVMVINPKTFTSSDVNTSNNSITISNHGLSTGDKIIHTSSSPHPGLNDNGKYYVVVFDENTIQLSNTYYGATKRIPDIVQINIAFTGEISSVNPKLKFYKDSTVVFDLSDSTLSYTYQSTKYSAFKLEFYVNSNFTNLFESSRTGRKFDIQKYGTIGVTNDAKYELLVTDSLPKKLYYKLTPIFDATLPENKNRVVIDDEVESNNELLFVSSDYNGKHKVLVGSSTSFTYTLKDLPEANEYNSSSSILSYSTDSLNAFGPIKEVRIDNAGFSYNSLPRVETVTSGIGSGAILTCDGKSIGKLKNSKIENIGFNFPTDLTLTPSSSLPQIIKVDPLNSIDAVEVTYIGKGYTVAPKLLVFDGKTNSLVPEADLRYNLDDSSVTILRNTFGLSDVEPKILPVNNPNGVGIRTVSYDSSTKDVTVTLSKGFSDSETFPFAVNDKVLIENVSVGVGSTGSGFNSSDYDYSLFKLTAIDPNVGGIGTATVTYNLTDHIGNGYPGVFDPFNSSGRVIPEKEFPVFESQLQKNNFLPGEKVKSNSVSLGIVDSWDRTNNFLKVISDQKFVNGEFIEGLSSNTLGIGVSVNSYDSFVTLNSSSKVDTGWQNNTGYLNFESQKIQDNFYYQNFAYSLKSNVDYNTWEDVVGSLNHTAGFKKFSDFQVETTPIDIDSLSVGLSTNLTSVDIVTDLVSVMDLDCVFNLDRVRENFKTVSSGVISDKIFFESATLIDYIESVGNRVLSIDDVSDEFNSNPRATRFANVYEFVQANTRSQKIIAYVKDRRYVNESQIQLLSVINDSSVGYLNNYARLSSSYDLGTFDFALSGDNGVIQFYPTKFSINDFNVSLLSYNLEENLLGIGSTSFGTSTIKTSSVSIEDGVAGNIVSVANTYTSAKVIVNVSSDTGADQFEEFSVIHDGTNVIFQDYGTLNSSLSKSISGLGTYHAYLDGSSLKVDFTPTAGIGSTSIVNSVQILMADSTTSGIGTIDLVNARLKSQTATISASGSPTENVIGTYPIDYGAAYGVIQISDTTNNNHQVSEFVSLATYDSSTSTGESYLVEYGNVETLSGLGTIGTRINGTNTVELVFTPLPNIDIHSNVYLNIMKHSGSFAKDPLSFNNSILESNYAIYRGTEFDIKRAFELKHKTVPIFEKRFDGSDSSVVNTTNNTFTIPDHFFVTGEKIIYHHGGELEVPIVDNSIEITSTNIPGIGITDKLPSELYVIKTSESAFKLASTAEKALSVSPEALDISNVGIGTFHRFVTTNKNTKVLVTLDNSIQSPIHNSDISTVLSENLSIVSDNVFVSGITSIFSGDLIKVGDEVMKITSVGIGSTNVFSVRRPWAGTSVSSYTPGTTVTKVEGNYNIEDSTIHFVEAPYGNLPFSTSTNRPDERDWEGISKSSKFHGRSFIRSGNINSTDSTYSQNYLFDGISGQFDGSKDTFTLKSQGSNVTGVSTQNAVVLLNDIFQGPGLNFDYTLNESVGITSIVFTGEATTSSDISRSTLPIGGVILNIGSVEGLGYQSLVSAGGTAIVSGLGTVQSVSIGNSGSGYRGRNRYEILTDTSNPIGAGSTEIYLENSNSVYDIINLLNTGDNVTIGVGTFINAEHCPVVSTASTFVRIGIGSTSSFEIPTGTQVSIGITNPTLGYVNVSVANSDVGVTTSVYHVGFATIMTGTGNISTNVTVTYDGAGFTSSSYVIVDDPLSYSNIPLEYSSSSPFGVGLGTHATIDIVVGNGSSIIDFEINNSGYAYGQGEILTLPLGGLTGIPTTSSASFSEFKIDIQKTFTDKFVAWNIGDLQVFDQIENEFNGSKRTFQLKIDTVPTAIKSASGSKIDVKDVILVFINDILQVPGEAYVFLGGSLLTFTEPPQPQDRCRILFYKGTGSVDVIPRDILESVKVGDSLQVGYDPYNNQEASHQEEDRTVSIVDSTDLVSTNPYFGPGNTNDESLVRPVVWCKQRNDKIIDGKIIGKDRELYEPKINPLAYLIQSVGIGSTIISVDNIRPFFNPINESGVTLAFQDNITFVPQVVSSPAFATAIVSSASTVQSISITDGGSGYQSTPTVSIQSPVGLGTTQRASASASLTNGVVTGITVTGSGGTSYSSSKPPLVLVSPPIVGRETAQVDLYEGDSGIIVGISTTSIGVAHTGLVFDLHIPENSFFRDSSVTGLTTVSGIQTGYYFTVYNSNVGSGVTTLDSSGQQVGVGTIHLDNVYEAISVSIGQTDTPGLGYTYVAKVTVSLKDSFYGLDDSNAGIGYSNMFGEYSWGRITLRGRNVSTSYPTYTSSGIVGISTGTIVRRSSSMKYTSYSE